MKGWGGGPGNSRFWLVLGVCGILLAGVRPSTGFAYGEFSHEGITRSALAYLLSHRREYPETEKWVARLKREGAHVNGSLLEESLVRAVIDTDYRTDLWMKAWFHPQINGTRPGGTLAMFTTLFHFLNVTRPGRYWRYDGYSYAESTRIGNDRYLSSPSLRIVPSTRPGAPSGDEERPLNEGIIFSEPSAGRASRAYFPPSYLPAERAYADFLKSPRAPTDLTESWTESSPLVTGVFRDAEFIRHSWRGEVAGLPRSLDRLGVAIHLTQDATVPHHVEGTSDRCHPEYENALDQWSCRVTTPLDYGRYHQGEPGLSANRCDALYDPTSVRRILAEQRLIDRSHPLSISDRMIHIALLTARWDWRASSPQAYAMRFPDGRTLSADRCETLVSSRSVRRQAVLQFNLAIAATVSLLESAARDSGDAASDRLAAPQLAVR